MAASAQRRVAFTGRVLTCVLASRSLCLRARATPPPVVEMGDAKVGGAKDSAGRSVSKLLTPSSHAVAKDDHGSFTYEVRNNDQPHCEAPCYVGVSDLQVPVFGPAMANVVHGVNDKIYV